MGLREMVLEILPPISTWRILASGYGIAPINIALIKYWGKRNIVLNLPVTDSLSVSLRLFTTTTIKVMDSSATDFGQPLAANGHPMTDYADSAINCKMPQYDVLCLNGKNIPHQDPIHKRLTKFLNLFRLHKDYFFCIVSTNDVPTGAGLASSASAFAALTYALNDLFSWNLDDNLLSIIARIGSGSGCRSIFPGFVRWYRGERDDGLDSKAALVDEVDPSCYELSLGMIMVEQDRKVFSSRDAMIHTVKTAPFFLQWSQCVTNDLEAVLVGLARGQLDRVMEIAQANALSMHGMMLSSRPPFSYLKGKSLDIVQQLLILQRQGLEVYCTIDGGPNIKLLFSRTNQAKVLELFPQVHLVEPLWAPIKNLSIEDGKNFYAKQFEIATAKPNEVIDL